MKINWFKIMNYPIYYYLADILINKQKNELAWDLIFLKQGNICKDCEKSHGYCNCNECDICGYDYCLCDITSDEDLNNFVFKLSKYILSPEILDKLLARLIDFRNLSESLLIQKYKNIINYYNK